MSTHNMIIFSAPSGSGKTTIINHLLHKGYPIEFSVSATTRLPRGCEKHGVEYYFLSLDDFKSRIERDEFIEYEEVYENRFYGTLRSECERIWNKGKTIVFDVDVAGGIRLKELFGDKALAIFIKLSSLDELERRLRARGTDTEQEIQKRLEKASYEIGFSYMFDEVIVNENLEEACKQTEQLLHKFL
ncbi:MAG: guanylate kinase [Bacteroidales bacterium]